MKESFRPFWMMLFFASSFLVFSANLVARDVFPGYYKITNLQSGKSLDVRTTALDGLEVYQSEYQERGEQQWEIIWLGEDRYKIINRKYRQVLDLKGSSLVNGSSISLWEYLGTSNQQWCIQKRGESLFSICSSLSEKSLDVPLKKIGQESRIQQYDYTGHGNQIWKFEKIESPYSGLYFIFNEFYKLGIDADAGGAIAWISEVDSDRNVVNTKDLGRYIQQSHYAGSSLNRREEGQSKHWSPFPWNAIQAGDFFGNKPIIMDLVINDGSLYVKSRPLLWDMDGDYAQAYFETWITLDGLEIVYHSKFTRFVADDHWGEKENFQELPACYLSADLKNFYSYTGSDVWQAHFNQIPNEKIWEDWITHESWIACVDDSLWGFSVYFPGVATFSGGLYTRGEGDDPTAYVSPQLDLTLKPHDEFEYRCFFQLGKLNEMQHRIYIRHHQEELRMQGLLQE